MIKLESVYIEEVRGIKKLELNLNKQTFSICGPNGSGKSGIIDSIEFGLTGQMGRLTGRGTKGLSVSQHGPHVDKVKFPDAAFVRLKLFLGDLNKTVTITRYVSEPKKLKIEPNTPAIKAKLDEIADHPEITLSRREILRFILVEPTKRSEEIQALLKLEEIGEARKTLNTCGPQKLHLAVFEADVTLLHYGPFVKATSVSTSWILLISKAFAPDSIFGRDSTSPQQTKNEHSLRFGPKHR